MTGKIYVLSCVLAIVATGANATEQESIANCITTLSEHAGVNVRSGEANVDVGWFTDTVRWLSSDIECKVKSSGVDYLRVGGEIVVIDGFAGADAKSAYEKMARDLDAVGAEKLKAFSEFGSKLESYEAKLRQPHPDVASIVEEFNVDIALLSGEFYKTFFEKNSMRIEFLDAIEEASKNTKDELSEELQIASLSKRIVELGRIVDAEKFDNNALQTQLNSKNEEIDRLKIEISNLEKLQADYEKKAFEYAIPEYIEELKGYLGTLEFEKAEKTFTLLKSKNALDANVIKELEALALRSIRPIPSSETEKNLLGYRFLRKLAPENTTYKEKIIQYSGIAPGTYWVNDTKAAHPTLHSCPSLKCGKVGSLYHGNKVEALEGYAGFARITEYVDVQCENGKIIGGIDSGRSDCSAENGVKNGKIARWVEISYLSPEKPEKPVPSNDAEKWIAGSDDFEVYRKQFSVAALDLVRSGKCSQSDFQDNGGWWASPSRGKGMYFVWCKGNTVKYYLNAETGRVDR